MSDPTPNSDPRNDQNGSWQSADYNDNGRVVFIPYDDSSGSHDGSKPVSDKDSHRDGDVGEGLHF